MYFDVYRCILVENKNIKQKLNSSLHFIWWHSISIRYHYIYKLFFIKWKHFPRLMAICAGNSPVTGEFPAQRPVARSFDVFSDLRLDKRLSKQSWGWWFEKPSRPLWRHCYVFKQTDHRRLLWLHDAECFIVIEGVKTVKWTTFDVFRNY